MEGFEKDDIQAVAQTELEQLKTYRQIYEETDPSPSPPVYKQPRLKAFKKSNYSFMEVVGIVATGYILSAAGGLLYSSIRTIGIFANMVKDELSAYGWNASVVTALTTIAAGAIMLAVEGFLAAYGYDKGKESGKISTNFTGVAVAFLLSVGAGFIASLSLVDPSAGKATVEYWTDLSMAGLAALGVGLLVYFGCHNLGVIHTSWLTFLRDREDEIEEYNRQETTQVEEYNRQLDANYQANLAAWQERFERDYRSKGRAILFGAGTYTVKRSVNNMAAPANKTNGNGLGERISEYLRSAGFRPTEVGDGLRVQPVQIADALNLTADERKQIHIYLGRLRKKDEQGQWQ